MRKKKEKPVVFDEKELQKELMHSARAVGMSAGAVEVVVEKVAQKVGARVRKRAAVTVEDINRYVSEEAEKYNKDLAYVYENRGKII